MDPGTPSRVYFRYDQLTLTLKRPMDPLPSPHSESTSTGSDDLASVIGALVRVHAQRPGGLLPLLHDVQDQLGYIPPSCVATIAKGLNLSRAEVHGVVTFYHYFRTKLIVGHLLQICRAEACQAAGSDGLVRTARESFGCVIDGPSSNPSLTAQSVYCLGLCSVAPAVQLDDQPVGRLNPESFSALLTQTCSRNPSVS